MLYYGVAITHIYFMQACTHIHIIFKSHNHYLEVSRPMQVDSTGLLKVNATWRMQQRQREVNDI